MAKAAKVTTVTIADLALTARDAQSAVSARFRGGVDDVSLAFEGDLGPLSSLVQHHWPYPVTLKGQINDQQVAVDTKLRVDDATISLDPLEVGVAKSKVTGKLAITPGKPRPKWVFKFAAPTLALADIALPVKGGPQRPLPRLRPNRDSFSAKTRSTCRR